MTIKTIAYTRVPELQCLGRNRYFSTAGIDLFMHGPDIRLEPRTGKDMPSGACRIVIPRENAFDVATALVQFAGDTALLRYEEPAPPGRLARLVAKWRGQPVEV